MFRQPKRSPMPEYFTFLKTVRLVRANFRCNKPVREVNFTPRPKADLGHQVVGNPTHLPPCMMGKRPRPIIHPVPVIGGHVGRWVDKRIPTPRRRARHIQKHLLAAERCHPHEKASVASQQDWAAAIRRAQGTTVFETK